MLQTFHFSCLSSFMLETFVLYAWENSGPFTSKNNPLEIPDYIGGFNLPSESGETLLDLFYQCLGLLFRGTLVNKALVKGLSRLSP